MNVLFFDIDGTLINTRGSGLTALKNAFAEVFGLPAAEGISAAGRTDRAIAQDLFLARAVEDSQENWRRFIEAYPPHLVEQLPQCDGFVLPGVVALLEELAARDDVAMGLLTGNTSDGARIKLEHFGLYRHFAFGGYGDRHTDRGDVARLALDAARAALNHDLQLNRVWVIGDTPFDIRCARHIGAKAAAVATGFHDTEELAGENPDLLLNDLRQGERLVRLLD
jgi:phosphoglycolate phosphatase-like HAD superfamily hydrolase